jgi:uncharacterized protein (TIGR02147 family)
MQNPFLSFVRICLSFKKLAEENQALIVFLLNYGFMTSAHANAICLFLPSSGSSANAISKNWHKWIALAESSSYKKTMQVSPPSEHNYRAFLKHYAESTKKKRPSWSYAAWAKAMGLKSTSSLTKIIQGDREPGPEIVEKLVRYFKFNAKEEDHFRNLVLLQKSKRDPHLQKILLKKATQEVSVGFEGRLLEVYQFQLISDWWHLGIRELLKLKNFIPAKDAIAKVFRGAVSSEQVKESLAVLEKLSLIKNTGEGYDVLDTTTATTNGIPSEAIQLFHEQMLTLARDRLKDTAIPKRHYEGMTFLVDEDKLPDAKLLIQDFLDRFEKLMGTPKADALYQIQLQLFPLTKTLKEKYEVKK